MWSCLQASSFFFFFFNDTATTEIYTLSLHDALPISATTPANPLAPQSPRTPCRRRSEEHTSELQSHLNIVCRLLLEKKKQQHSLSAFDDLDDKKRIRPRGDN